MFTSITSHKRIFYNLYSFYIVRRKHAVVSSLANSIQGIYYKYALEIDRETEILNKNLIEV